MFSSSQGRPEAISKGQPLGSVSDQVEKTFFSGMRTSFPQLNTRFSQNLAMQG